MASRAETVQYVVDQLAGLPGIWTRKMFGEYALYLDQKVVALIADDQFFLKPSAAAKALIEAPSMGRPYPGATLFYLLTDELEQRDFLKQLVKATANALPLPKPKAATKKPRSGAQAPASGVAKTPKFATKPVAKKAAKKVAKKVVKKAAQAAIQPAAKKLAKKVTKKSVN